MTLQNNLVNSLVEAAKKTPYHVEPTKKGFKLSYNIVDEQYYSLMYKEGIRKQFTITGIMHQSSKKVATTDTSYEILWKAGVGAGKFYPTLKTDVSFAKGELFEWELNKIFAFNKRGEYGKVVDYKFSSADMKRWLDTQLKANGWNRTLGLTAKLGVILAAIAIGAIFVGLVFSKF